MNTDVTQFLDSNGLDNDDLNFSVDDYGNSLLNLAVQVGDKVMV
jgi:hypothetical protein